MPLEFAVNTRSGANLNFAANARSGASVSFLANARVNALAPGLREASQSEAEAGAILGRYMSPLRVFQAIDAATGALTDGDKGDITVSASGATWTIDNDVVSFAKMQNIATDRLLGRDTASSGDVEELTVGGGLEFTGSAGIQRSALTGDVTATAGSSATTIASNAVTTAKIANDQVTYAKIQDVAASDRLLGRDTAGAGDVEEISLNATLEFTGSQSIQRAALTGDVTASAGSNATTIANNAVTTAKILDANVTYAKIQDVSAASKLLGRGDSGSGDVQEITLGTSLSMSGTTLNTSDFRKWVTSDFSKTSDTTLADVTGLTQALLSGKTYKFRSVLFTTSNTTGGVKAAVAFSGTTSAVVLFSSSADVGASFGCSGTTTAFGTYANSGGTLNILTVEGTFTTTSTGTLSIQFAQSSSNGTASIVKQGSFLTIEELP